MLSKNWSWAEYRFWYLQSPRKVEGTVLALSLASLWTVRRELKTLVVSGRRFQPRTHALDSIEAPPNRFGDIYFSLQIMNFQEFSKIHQNSWLGASSTCWPLDIAEEEREDHVRVREVMGSVTGCVLGTPQSINLSVIMSALFIPHYVTFGGPKTDFRLNSNFWTKSKDFDLII